MGERKWAETLFVLFIVLVDCDQRAAILCTTWVLVQRAVQSSFFIAAVFLEDTQTFPQSAEGTICFQTTGLLPDTLSAWWNSSFLLLLHDETWPWTPQFTFGRKPTKLHPETVSVKGGDLIILLFKLRKVSSACSGIRDRDIQLTSAASESTTGQIHM